MTDRHPLDGNATEALRTAHIAAKEAIRAAQRLADDTYDAWRDAVEAEADAQEQETPQ